MPENTPPPLGIYGHDTIVIKLIYKSTYRRVTKLSFRWNQLDILIVVLSIVGIILEEIKSGFIPINPTIIRVMRVMRIARGNVISFIIIRF